MAARTAVEMPVIDDDAMEFGQLYRSTAVVVDPGEELPPALPPEQWCGHPGTRAPHLWLSEDKQRSTLDLFGGVWVLLADDELWYRVAAKASDRLGIAMRCLRIGDEVRPPNLEALRRAFGLSKGGASLVRPDGYVAWRVPTLPEDPLAALTDALRQVSSAAAALGGGALSGLAREG